MQSSDIADRAGEVRDILDVVEKRHGREEPPEDTTQDLQQVEIAIEKLESLREELK